MSRRPDERSVLRPVLAEIGRTYAAREEAWAEQIDPRVLRRFRRDLAGSAERLAEPGASPAALDRARAIAAGQHCGALQTLANLQTTAPATCRGPAPRATTSTAARWGLS
jgi:hypothetical protein